MVVQTDIDGRTKDLRQEQDGCQDGGSRGVHGVDFDLDRYPGRLMLNDRCDVEV